MKLRLESINGNIRVPLPRFSRQNRDQFHLIDFDVSKKY